VTPLRFGLLTTFYPPYNFGGDGIDVQRTARALVRRGHQVTVIHDVDAYEWLAGRHLPATAVPGDDGVEVIALRSRLGVVSPLLTHQFGRPVVHGRAIADLLARRGCDVVMFNNVSLVGGPGLLAYGGDALKVYMAHEHWLVCPTHVLWRNNEEPCQTRTCGQCVVSYRRPPQLWRYTGALERRLPDVDLFIARSEFSRQKHHDYGFSQPMRVLPYFLPGTLPAQPVTRTAASPHHRPYFLFVGRLTRIKGLDSVIPVLARYPDADLLIVGDGEEETALRAQAAHLPNVRFVGRVPNEDLARYYEHAIASIVPSVGYETFGIVLIEAFRHQTPVIARRIGPFPEIVEQSGGGLLFANDDELLTAMQRLQRDAILRDSLAARAYAACRERWSEDVVIGRLLEYVADAFERRAVGVPAARVHMASVT
jgi:glycosyltransferase involved in cell wall biosynthesis